MTYCIVMSVVQGYKRNGTQKYKDNQTLFVVLVSIAKLIKLLVDLIIHYLFFNFIVFFLNFRKLEQRKLSCFNYLILGIVMVLFFASLLSSVFIFGLFITYTDSDDWNTAISTYAQLVAFDIIYIKDTLISLMLSYLFFYKGKQQ